MQFVNEIERALGVGRALHVDAHKARGIHRGGFGDQSADDIAREFFVYIEPHVREFETDVGVELVGDDRVENLMVELRAVAGFVGIGDIFTEVVDGDAHAGAVDDLR